MKDSDYYSTAISIPASLAALSIFTPFSISLAAVTSLAMPLYTMSSAMCPSRQSTNAFNVSGSLYWLVLHISYLEACEGAQSIFYLPLQDKDFHFGGSRSHILKFEGTILTWERERPEGENIGRRIRKICKSKYSSKFATIVLGLILLLSHLINHLGISGYSSVRMLRDPE